MVRSKLQAEGLSIVPMALFPKGAMWGIAEFAENAHPRAIAMQPYLQRPYTRTTPVEALLT